MSIWNMSTTFVYMCQTTIHCRQLKLFTCSCSQTHIAKKTFYCSYVLLSFRLFQIDYRTYKFRFYIICLLFTKKWYHLNIWYHNSLPGDPAILSARHGLKICRFGADVSLDRVDPGNDDADTLLRLDSFLHTKWIKTSFPSRIRLSLSSPSHCKDKN